MSLELAIQQNTAAINALIEILSRGASPSPITNEAPAETEQPKAKRAKKEAKPEAPAGEPAPEQPAPSPETGASDASETAAAAAPTEAKQITYTEASAAVVKLANTKGRKAAVDVLASFGAKTLGEVKASRYADVIAACEAVK